MTESQMLMTKSEMLMIKSEMLMSKSEMSIKGVFHKCERSISLLRHLQTWLTESITTKKTFAFGNH